MYGVIIAFKKFDVIKGILGSPWVGLKYFAKFIDDPFFWQAVKNTFILGFLSIVLAMPASIILALLLNEISSIKYKRFVQTTTYLPHFISTVVVCGMIVNFLNNDGIINRLLKSLGGEAVQFMLIPGWFRPIFILSDIWQNMGWGSIIYLAAISGINPELYEAARIDGANRLKQAWYITLPSIAPTISILLILRIGRILTVSFQKVLLLYNPATYKTADVIQTYVYRRGLLGAQFSYATAIGLFQSVVGLVLLIAANRLSKRLSETSLW
jgi:putative aldouronate transport system permease protein